MIDVEVGFEVKSNSGTKEERMFIQVDYSTYSLASGSESKRKLDSWAKTFFPAAVSARVIYMLKAKK